MNFKKPFNWGRMINCFRTLAKLFGLFLIIFIGLFVVLNSSAIFIKLGYHIPQIAGVSFGADEFSKEEANEVENKILLDDRLIISKINVDVPIIWAESSDEDIIQKELYKGVVHLAGSAFPGEDGNCFITGHSSSRNLLHKGEYDTVFTLLNELEIGDKIFIYWEQEKFIYQVQNKKVVSKYDTTVSEDTAEPILTLATCWPIGTDLKRLVVRAELME